MTYDWEPHKETCRRLYVDERKKLPQIAEYFRVHHNFVPSMRTFLVKFRQWGFPLRQPRLPPDERLVARIRELWEQNLSQKDMLRTLNQKDGFSVSKRELVRIRTKNRWLLRVNTTELERKTGLAAAPGSDEDDSGDDGSDGGASSDAEAEGPRNETPEPPAVPPHILAEREERKRRLEQESTELYASRKRRRRTMPRAGLPPDPPGPPRFPSETTLTEAKAILGLDRETYLALRKKVQWVCEEAGVFKKTVAGPERWEAVKDRVVAETPHLRSAMWVKPDNTDAKKLALDVIAADVTKGMRTKGKVIRLAEARTLLGLNPEESRDVRFTLWRLLKDDRYETKLAMGEARWNELRQQWIDTSPPLQAILAQPAAPQERQVKLRAIHALARDVMKRLRDDQLRRERRKEAGAQSGEADADGSDDDGMGPDMFAGEDAAPTSPAAAGGAPSGRVHSQARLVPAGLDAQAELDAQLAHTMADAQPPTTSYGRPGLAPRPPPARPPAPAQPRRAEEPVAIFLRPHPASTFAAGADMWIATLGARSVIELRRAAAEKFPGAACLRIDGLIKDGSGREVPLKIDQDQQLAAYLAHEEVSPTFSVQLVPAWSLARGREAPGAASPRAGAW